MSSLPHALFMLSAGSRCLLCAKTQANCSIIAYYSVGYHGRQAIHPEQDTTDPKKTPSRPTLTKPPLQKRKPDPPSLRHDKRSDDIKPKDNDRKRRGKIYFEQYSHDGVEVGVNNAEAQSQDDGWENEVLIDDYYGDHSGDSSFEQPPMIKSSSGLLKLSIDTTQKTPGKTIAGLLSKDPSKDSSKPASKTPPKRAPPLSPAAKSFIPYSELEYSGDEIGGGGDTKKTRRRDDDPPKCNHNVDWYLNTENSAVESEESEELPETKDFLISNDPLPEGTPYSDCTYEVNGVFGSTHKPFISLRRVI
ncbi:hypothetical protein DL95DRAFT_504944 [Leptodontidium sp. 2 PMI_412]|nr:hypothetical protein DL95DRAFT_504944 [Leptodontidium sp. 2 PMI_412]